MSFLPKLRYSTSPEKVENIKFYGIDRNEGASEGSFIDSRNMVSRDYPFLSSRESRFYSKLPDGMKLLGIYSAKELCFILNDGAKSYFYFDGEVKGEWDDAEGKEKFFCEVGGSIYIFPDRKLYRMKDEKAIEEYKMTHPRTFEGTADFKVTWGDYHSRNTFTIKHDAADFDFENGDAINIWCFDEAGEKIPLGNIATNQSVALSGSDSFRDLYIVGAPDGVAVRVGYKSTYPPEYGEAFCDFAGGSEGFELHKDEEEYQYLLLKKYHVYGPTGGEFIFSDFGEILEHSFSDGMNVWFSYTDDSLGEVVTVKNAVIEECGIRKFTRASGNYVYAPYLKFAPDTFTITTLIWNYGTTEKGWRTSGESGWKYIILRDDDNERAYIGVSPKYPNLSGAVNVNNRLWGYESNVIYASSLGKPYIMGDYSGISTDSWAVETGIKRDFTAVYSYNSIPHFFTEDGIIKVYGSGPSSFSTSETVCAGVKEGSSASLSVCGGILYYLDKDGNIASYTGSYPSVASRRLNEVFANAMTSSDDRYLYCVCKREGGRKVLYVFDTLYGIWLIDGELEANYIINHDGCVYICVDGYIITDKEASISGFERYTETGFESMLEFPVTDERLFNMKKLKKVLFKINAEEGTSLCVEVRETDSPEYRRIFERVIEGGDEVLTIPVDCRRTLGYSVRISGKGKWRLEGIMRRVSVGSYKS